MKLVFMGTPEFAVKALDALYKEGHEMVAVYTQPPRPAGRGHKETLSPVHLYAKQHHLPVYTPLHFKQKEILETCCAIKADLAIVCAYGLLLPAPILHAWPKGCINIHASLLPHWRGAAPIFHTILEGDKETGITLMQMNEGLDTGDILLKKVLPLSGKETAGELHDRLSVMGAEAMVTLLRDLPHYTPHPQPTGATYAAKISKKDALIDWNEPAPAIERRIRACYPWPGAYTFYQGEIIKIKDAIIVTGKNAHGKVPGTLLDNHFTIACGENTQLRPLHVQRSGKKEMPVAEMLRGFPIMEGEKLTSCPVTNAP